MNDFNDIASRRIDYMDQKTFTLTLADRTITATFSNLTSQADGSVLLSCEDTVVLATAVMTESTKKNPGFFNLTVEYLEKFYASGSISGSQFNRREGRPSDKAILSSRVIDRTIRPLFDQKIKNAVQVIVTVLAVGKADPTILAVNATSLALSTSDIPWNGPVGAVHISRAFDGTKLEVNNYITPNGEPTGAIDLTVCGKDGNINMIEAMTFETNEEEVTQAFELASTHIGVLETWQKEVTQEIGKKKRIIDIPKTPETIVALFKEFVAPVAKERVFGPNSKERIGTLEKEWAEQIEKRFPELADDETFHEQAQGYFDEQIDMVLHRGALQENKRADGRAFDEIRPLFAQAGGISSVLHGSGIFYRGETHIFSALTLGGPEDTYVLDGMEVKGEKRFMHHYNFPPYSVGETGRVGGINRREMGHGFLAEKALTPIIPKQADFPYTIRVVSETMSSNGSSSQGSICAATLALMDGGVPIKAPVAGIAMGLMADYNDQGKMTDYKILTDIQGPEDHWGDMDFKIAGTKNGVTAIQLDIKVDGIPVSVLREALAEAKKARLKILDVLTAAIPEPRKDLSASAPRILTTTIKPDQIGLVIGGGGKTIKAIKEDTGAEITIEDDGRVYVTGKSADAERALSIIKDIVREIKSGDVFEGEVVKVLDIGAVVKLTPMADGLVHISEIAPFRVARVSDLLSIGMKVPVKVINVDPERGRISLSIKEVNPSLFKLTPPPAA